MCCLNHGYTMSTSVTGGILPMVTLPLGDFVIGLTLECHARRVIEVQSKPFATFGLTGQHTAILQCLLCAQYHSLIAEMRCDIR